MERYIFVCVENYEGEGMRLSSVVVDETSNGDIRETAKIDEYVSYTDLYIGKANILLSSYIDGVKKVKMIGCGTQTTYWLTGATDLLHIAWFMENAGYIDFEGGDITLESLCEVLGLKLPLGETPALRKASLIARAYFKLRSLISPEEE